jgi:hypothetical protein
MVDEGAGSRRDPLVTQPRSVISGKDHRGAGSAGEGSGFRHDRDAAAHQGEREPVSLLDALPEDERRRARPAAQPKWIAPMLASLTQRRFSDPNWIFERSGAWLFAKAARPA